MHRWIIIKGPQPFSTAHLPGISIITSFSFPTSDLGSPWNANVRLAPWLWGQRVRQLISMLIPQWRSCTVEKHSIPASEAQAGGSGPWLASDPVQSSSWQETEYPCLSGAPHMVRDLCAGTIPVVDNAASSLGEEKKQKRPLSFWNACLGNTGNCCQGHAES